MISVLLVFGCSVEKNYRTLSFFFDGVPNPYLADSLNAQARMDSIQTAKFKENKRRKRVAITQPREMIYTHKVYNRKSCGKCHQSSFSNSLKVELPGLCFQCHDNFYDQYKYLHGPVAAGFCLACHEQHKGKYEKLLKQPRDKLCLYCHDQRDIEKNPRHQPVKSGDCFTCHDPHGSQQAYFLKENRPE